MKAPMMTTEEAYKLVRRNEDATLCKMLLVLHGLTDMLHPIAKGGLAYAIDSNAELMKGVPPFCVLIRAFRAAEGKPLAIQAFAIPESVSPEKIEGAFAALMLVGSGESGVPAAEAHLFEREMVDIERN